MKTKGREAVSHGLRMRAAVWSRVRANGAVPNELANKATTHQYTHSLRHGIQSWTKTVAVACATGERDGYAPDLLGEGEVEGKGLRERQRQLSMDSLVDWAGRVEWRLCYAAPCDA